MKIGELTSSLCILQHSAEKAPHMVGVVGELALTFISHVVAWSRERYPPPACPSPPAVSRRARLGILSARELSLPSLHQLQPSGEQALCLTWAALHLTWAAGESSVELTQVAVAQVSWP